MAKRCTCEGSTTAGPSTYRGIVHNIWPRQRGEPRRGRCVHDELGKTVQPFKRYRSRPVLGTRRIVATYD